MALSPVGSTSGRVLTLACSIDIVYPPRLAIGLRS
jgi:hypothetical protein